MRNAGSLVALVGLALLAAACSSGVDEERVEAEGQTDEVAALEDRVQAAEDRLEEVEGGTMLKFVHTAFGPIPEGVRDGMVATWDAQFERIRQAAASDQT